MKARTLRTMSLLAVLAALLLAKGWLVMTHSAETAVHPHERELTNDDGSWKYTNKLADETSPYLLQHAHNPVDWYPWGPEAFAEARREGKPIFLSIGYSTCYWCHVMERLVFENPEIAEQMNKHVVSIKVDREERPDVDEIYMTATQILTQHGGWPMSVFLTPPGAAGEDDPGLKPFYCGTYFPPQPSQGMPSFPQVVEGMSNAWGQQRAAVLKQADSLAEAVRQRLRHRDESGPVDSSVVQNAGHQLLRIYDQEHGGFGNAPKFPTPNNLLFLIAVYRNSGEESVWEAVAHSLDRMARGGVYDQVGGGFHRYSVDEKWLVPHFEKMLYDNGQLLQLYAAAYAEKPGDEACRLYVRVLRETCEYVMRDMTDATGAFWSAQDAEVNTREGGNYVWTKEQVKAAIDDSDLSALALNMYGLDRGPNFTDPHAPDAGSVNVLYLPRSLPDLAGPDGDGLDETLEKRRRINALLKAVRDKRDQPSTDDKVLVAWNGLMVGGLAAVGRMLNEPKYVDAAAGAAEAVVRHMSSSDGGLYRTMRGGEAKIPAFVEDYAFFVHGLIELHRARTVGGAGADSPNWLELAERYSRIAVDRFACASGGYYDTLEGQADLFVRTRSTYDGAIPTGNSQMVHNLLDLVELTQNQAYLRRAVNDLRSFAPALRQQGLGMAHMHHALLRALEVAAGPLAAKSAPGPSPGPQPVAVSVEPERIDLTTDRDTLTVTLTVHEDYHINSNVPGDDALIPTTVQLVGPQGLALDVDYPAGHLETYAFADKPLSVYHGQVTIGLTVRKVGPVAPGAQAKLVLNYQACTDTACLLPRSIELPLTIQ